MNHLRGLASTSSVPPRVLFLLVVLTLVWGTNWPLFPIAVREISVWTFRTIAVFVCGLVLLVIARARGQSLAIPRRHWPAVIAATFCYLVIWNIASTYAAILIPSGQSAVLGFTMPLWSALISWAILGERISGRMLLAIALGATSVTLLMVPNLGVYAGAPLGLALGLLAGFGWAVGTLILKRRRIDVPVTVLTGWQMLLTTIPIAVGAALTGDGEWFMPNRTSILVIAWIILVPMCIGNVCWFSIVGLLPANVAGLSSILVPVVAMISGALVHAEPLGPLQWIAMGLTVAALSLALLKPETRPDPPQAR